MAVDFDICLPPDTTALPSSPQPIAYLDPEEEIARGPACWLWDYLRRCGEQTHPRIWGGRCQCGGSLVFCLS